jgi:hypothetical protein
MKEKQNKESVPGIGGVPYREIAENYKIAEDFSASVKCSVCRAWTSYDATSKQALLIHQKSEAAKTWVCNECYKKAHEPNIIPNAQDVIQERIAYHGSWNLAVAMVAPLMNSLRAEDEADGELAKKALEKWQVYFYDKLTNRL